MNCKWSALVLSLFLCLAPEAGALVVYTENSDTQFNAGSYNSTYITGSGLNVNLGLDYYGDAAGFSAPGSNEWFNSAWKYRQLLTINSSNPSPLSNYSVAVTINTQDAISGGRMNADGSDIRFTTAAVSGSAPSLPYYIESGINTAVTKIWVNIPSITAGANNLYLYSGNTSAAAVSGMAGTFTMGDNFNAANGSAPSTATWTNIQSNTPSAGALSDIQSNRLRLLFGSPLNLRYFGLRSAAIYSIGAGKRYHAEVNARASGSDSWSTVTLCPSFYNYSDGQSAWLRFSVKHSAGGATYTVDRKDYGTKATLASGVLGAGFHGVDFLISASSFSVLLDGSQVYGGTNDLTIGSPYIYLEASSASSSLDEFLFDNVSVQSYSPPDPTYTSSGAGQGRRYPSGEFVSQTVDSGAPGTRYLSSDWAAITPSSSSLSMEMRANDTDVALGTFTAVSKGGDPAVYGRYAQYRINLATLDPRYTATVSSVAISYVSPPLAPSGAAGAMLSATSIKWSWTDNSSGQYQEDGFRVMDATGVIKSGSLASGSTYWIETGLIPNTQYSRLIAGYNSSGQGASSAAFRYTLPASPSVGCDKSTGTWLSGTLACTNLAGFGSNGVAYYRYVWTQLATYSAWSGSETQWLSGSLTKSDFTTGNWYLHVRSYNGENTAADAQTYGPYWYDKNAPTITGFSPSSSPWVNTYVTINPSVALADTGGSKLFAVRNNWTGSTSRPYSGDSGWQAWDYSISGNDTASSSFIKSNAGQWYLHIEVQDTAGNIGYSYSGPYKIDKTNPSGSVVINNASDTYTPRKEVTLSLIYSDSESGVKSLRYKNLGGNWSASELPQPTTAWALIDGDGNKQVYLEVTDNAGNTYQTADTINLNSQTSLVGSAISGTASGVMGEPAETFSPRAVLSWTPTGAVLSGKTLSFYFNGSTNTAVTDSQGAASSSFNIPTASGTYVYSVSFSTDGVYSVSSSTGVLTAAQRGVSLITEDVNATSGVNFTAKATLRDFFTNDPITGSAITFSFGSSTKTAFTSAVGVATVTFTAPLLVGIYSYSASYDGSAVYAPKSGASGVGVGLRVTNLSVPGVSAMAQADFYAQATLTDGALPVQGSTITFVFQGYTQTAITNASGVAVSSYTAPASSGTYSYTADFPGDGTYAASSGAAALTVNRRPLSLAGETSQGYVDATFLAHAKLYDGITADRVAGKQIVFVFEGSSAAVTTDSNGAASASFNSGSAPRDSTYYSYFAGDSGYAFADSTATVSIVRRLTSLAASDTTALLSSTFTAIVALKDTSFATPVPISGKLINFSFLGSTQTAITNDLGVASVTYQTGLSTGAYDFYASFAQDGSYLAANDTGTVTMTKRTVVVSAYPWYGFALDSIKPVADLKDGVTGAYIGGQPITFTYNGTPQSTITVASGGTMGKAYAVYTGTGVAGTYSYSVDFPGNSLYSANSNTASITVSQRSVSLAAFPQTAIWSTTFTVTAEFRDGTTNATVNGKLIKITFSTAATNSVTAGAGVATSTFTAPAGTGTFNWLAEFAGDQTYAAASQTGTLTVIRRAPTLSAIAASKYVWDSIILNATFMDGDTPIASIPLSFSFNSSSNTQNTNGSGLATSLAFSSMSAPGNSGYTVQFAGDANYSALSASSTVTVSARPSNISIGPVSSIAGSTVTLTATLIDTNNGTRIMSGKPVSFTLQGSTYGVAAVTNGSGVAQAVFISSTNTGPYTYSATFYGNTNYAGTSSSSTLTVTLRPSVLEMADYYPPASSTFTVSAVLKDYTTGATISTQTVSFLFMTVGKSGVTNALGSAATSYVTISSTMSYPISASYAGNTLYSAASISKIVYPGRRNTALYTSDMNTAVALDTFTVTARLSDYDLGTYIYGATITFSFNSSNYTAFTNSTGTASAVFTAPASTGSYTYSAVFAGTALYNGTTNTSSVLVNRRAITIKASDLTSIPANSSFIASALLTDGVITVSTKTLTFVFTPATPNTKTAVTNVIGVASTTFLSPSSTGTFSYSVSFADGDPLYKPVSASGSVGVVLKNTVLTALDVADAVVGASFVSQAQLLAIEPGGNVPVASTKTVTFSFTTGTVNAITNVVAVATAGFVAPPTVGSYQYTAVFAGDGMYGASSSSGTVTVKRRPVIFSVSVPAGEPYTLSTMTVKANLVDGKTGQPLPDSPLGSGNFPSVKIYFSVSNTTHTIQMDALGVSSTTFYVGIASGTYRYAGTFDGNVSYNASEINDQTVSTVKINPRPTSLQPFSGDGMMMTWGVYTFSGFNASAYILDNLNGNSGISGLNLAFLAQGTTIYGTSLVDPPGRATSDTAFPSIAIAGSYPVQVTFPGNQTYAPSVLLGGVDQSQGKRGFVPVYQSPANIAMDAIQECFPSEDKVISGVAHDGYLGDRPNARPILKGMQVRYRISDTACIHYPDNCPWGTLGAPSYGNINDSYIATATVHAPTNIGYYPIERWFATTDSFYYWEVTEDKRILSVGRRPTTLAAVTDPVLAGAMMPITIKVKLRSTSQSDIGIDGKHVIITFNGGAPQDIVTSGGGFAQYIFTAGLVPGDYTYTAAFAEDTTYNGTVLNPVGNVHVQKNSTALTGTPVTLVPAGNNFIAKATLMITNPDLTQQPGVGRNINFTFPGVADQNNIVTNAQGVAQVTFAAPLTAQNTNFTATLVANTNDNGAVTVAPTHNVQVVLRNTSLTSVAVNPVYILDNFTSTATLVDLDAPLNVPPLNVDAWMTGRTINFNLKRGGTEGDTGNQAATTVASPLGRATKVFTSPLESGNKSYTASFAATSLYAAVTAADAGVTVLKRTTVLSAVEPTTPTNTIFTATVTLKDNTPTQGSPTLMGVNIHVPVKFVYNGVTNYGTTNDNGVATAVFTAQAVANNYTCDITYEGNTTYATSNLSLPVHVIKRLTSISAVDIINQPAGATFPAKATLTDDITGAPISAAHIDFVFNLVNSDFGTTDISGIATTMFTAPLSTGNYNYTACYPGDNTYAGKCDNTNTVQVNVASTTLSIPNAGILVNNLFSPVATLKGKESGVGVSGKPVRFTYAGVLKGTPLTAAGGTVAQAFTPISTGTFELDVNFDGDTAFYASVGTATIVVSTRVSGITMTNVITTVQAVFNATATLTDLSPVPAIVSGRRVNFLFNGVTISSATTDSVGVATTSFTAPPGFGSYPITATFPGDPIYGPSNTATASVTVSKRATQLTVLGNPATTALQVFTATATLKWAGGDVAGKVVSFTYHGVKLANTTEGSGKYYVDFDAGASSGPWQIDAAFEDGADAAYETSSGTNTITVGRRNCVVIPNNISMSVYDTFNATVTFKDVASSSTPAGKYPKVAFTPTWIASTGTATATNGAGIAYFQNQTAPASSGNYKVESWFPGDATYFPSISSTATVKVLQRPTQLSLADVPNAMIDQIFTATATLKNDINFLDNRYVLFTFETRTFNAKTTAGIAVATFTVTLSTGASRIDAIFNEDASYSASNASSATVTAAMRPTFLSTAATTVVADKDFIATATLRDLPVGFPSASLNVATQTISFLFNGTTKTAATNALGIATVTFTANVSTGSWPVTVTYAGSWKYVGSSAATIPLTVIQRATSLVSSGNVASPALDVFTDTVTLQDLDNLPLDAQSLRFVFSGSTFTKVTAGGGIAASTFSAPASYGTYYVNVYFDGNTKYSSSTVAITLTDAQRLTAIALSSPSVKAWDFFKTTATITDLNTPSLYKVSGATVTFNFGAPWGASTSALTDSVGLATAPYQSTGTAGNYTLTGTFAGNATYASTTTVLTFYVAKRSGYVTGVNISTRVFDLFTASATFYDSITSAPVSGRPIKFWLQGTVSTPSAPTNAFGVAAVTFTAPASSGTYNLSIWSDGITDLTYNQSSVYISSVTLARRDSSIALTGPTNAIIASTFTPTGIMYDSVNSAAIPSKTISFLFQNTTVPVTTNGSGLASTGYTANLSSGPYPLQASFAGDASYNPSVSTKSVNMLSYPTLLAAPTITVTINEVLTATATLSDYLANTVASKALVFYFNASSFTAVTNTLGVSYSTYSAPVSSGVYQMPLSFAGDAIYASTSTYIPVTVKQRIPSITPNPVSVQALDIFTATATLTDARVPATKLSGQTVIFEFIVNPTTFTSTGVTDPSGVATATFTATAPSGAYQLRTTFSGNVTYSSGSAYGTVTVLARPSKLMQDNSTAPIGEVFRTTATLVDAQTLTPISSTKTITFTYGASSAAFTDAGGKASVAFTAPNSSGTYPMSSLFAGDLTYDTSASTATLTVNRRPLSLAAPDILGIIDEVFKATVTVTDTLNSMPVSGRNAVFIFQGSTFTVPTNGSGVAVSTFLAPSSSGTYYAAINFDDGDARFLPNGTTAQVLVDRRPSAVNPDPVTARAAQVFTATASLVDVLNPGFKVAGGELAFVFSGSTSTAITGPDGVAVSTFMAPPSSGTAQISVSFSGNSRYKASSGSAAVTVLRRLSLLTIAPFSVKAMDVITATATLTDKVSGAVAPGRPVTFTFSTSSFVSATDADGIAVSTFSGPVSSGTYLVNANFDGDTVYDAATATGTITVIQRPTAIALPNSSAFPFEQLIATATLTDDATLGAIQGRGLSFILNGVSTEAVTSGVGVATAAYTPPSNFGGYTISATFPGDASYAFASSSGTVSVMRRPTAISALNNAAAAMDVFTASVTLSDVRFSTAVAGKEVTFTFEGKSSTAATGPDGTAFASFSAPVSSGVYFYQAQFDGDSVYDVSSSTGAVAVSTRLTRIVVKDTNANVGEPFKLTALLIDPAKEALPGYDVANVQMKFVFKDRNNIKIDEGLAMTNELGIATITFSGPGLPDVYYYSASFAGNYTYSASSATAMVKVGLLTSLVAFDVETIALENFPVKAKLTDYLSTTLDDKKVRFRFIGAAGSGMTNAGGDSGIAASSFTAPSSSGTYFYNAYFDGDSIYSASNATATINVKLRPAAIVPSPVATFAYSSFTATVLLTNILSPYAAIGGRAVDISFNGDTVATVTDPASGAASAVFFIPVSSGTYKYYARFAGDDTYDAASNTGTVTVQLRSTSMLPYSVTNLTANSTFTARVELRDNLSLPIEGLSVDLLFGTQFGVGATNAQGAAEAVFTAPASSGVYTFTGNFYGDERYAGSTANGNVTVGPRPTLVFTSAVSSKLNSPLGLSARLVDVAQQTGIGGQLLSFYFEGSTLSAVTDSFGTSTVTFSSPLSTGAYSYEASFVSDGITYISSSSSAPVTIALNLTKLDAKSGIGIKIYEPLPVEATLKDSLGLNLPGLPVTFSFAGSTTTSITSEVGTATAAFATTGLASTGTYNYTADYPGDTLYVASSDTSNVVTVSRRDSLLLAQNATTPPGKYFTAEARFYDNVNGSYFMGAPIAGKTVIFELHNSTFTTIRSAITSALGISTFTFTAPVSTGTFLLTARFAESDPVYLSALSSSTITVLLDDGTGAIKTKLKLDPASAYITKVFVASGTLTATDVPVTAKTVLFEFFNGIATYTAAGFTNSIGLATAAFTAPIASGTYNMTASFAGNMDFSAATGTSTLTANRYPDSLTAQTAAALSGEDFPAKAVLRDDLALAAISGKTVTFTFFNGFSTVTRTAVTSSTGSAETTFTSPATPGNYFYTASFAGDASYVGSMDSASILIASKGSSTFLIGYEVMVGTGEVFAASATLTSKGLPVQGKAITLSFQGLLRVSTTNADGLASSTFTAPASSGTIAYQASFGGDPLYNATLATAPVSVILRVQPEQPSFKAQVTSTSVTLAWTPVTTDQNHQVTGYEVNTAAELRPQTWNTQGFVSSTATTLGYTCTVDSNTATYLKITTKLGDNQESPTSLIVEVPSKADDPARVPNYYYMNAGTSANDWAAWVKIPGQVMNKVSSATFTMDVAKVNNPAFLAAYTVTASGDQKTLSSDLKTADRKGVRLTISYPKSGTGVSAASGQLAMYWFNGVEWVKLGGQIDVLTGEVYTYSRVLGQFAVKAAPMASSFTLTKVAPRIFSPDEASTNVNRARFYFENPDLGEVTIRIFDITGSLVRRNLESEGANIMYWNGKDQSGVLVKGGVYIYQIEAADKVLTGTVVVAK